MGGHLVDTNCSQAISQYFLLLQQKFFFWTKNRFPRRGLHKNFLSYTKNLYVSGPGVGGYGNFFLRRFFFRFFCEIFFCFFYRFFGRKIFSIGRAFFPLFEEAFFCYFFGFLFFGFGFQVSKSFFVFLKFWPGPRDRDFDGRGREGMEGIMEYVVWILELVHRHWPVEIGTN